jgi:hypothetical protein
MKFKRIINVTENGYIIIDKPIPHVAPSMTATPIAHQR